MNLSMGNKNVIVGLLAIIVCFGTLICASGAGGIQRPAHVTTESAL